MTAQAAFILLAVSAAIFFAMRKTVDPLAIAFGATLVYFTPGFSGEARFSYGQDLGEFSAPIVPLTYAAMAIVIAALVGSSAITDRVAWRGVWTASFMAKVPGVMLGFVAVASAVSVAHTGTNFLCLDKNITLANLDPWYSYAATASRPRAPRTLEQLRGIPGIGDKKLEHYGDELLALVQASRAEA